MACGIVSRGDGKPANFKKSNKCCANRSRDIDSAQLKTKMADGLDGLFVFGDDYKTILDILDEDESPVEKQFVTAVSAVSTKYLCSGSYVCFWFQSSLAQYQVVAI